MSVLPNNNIMEMVDRPASESTQAQFNKNPYDIRTYFNLRENPFQDNVNPDFFFRTNAHEEAFLKMQKCIDGDISMGLITARSGTGKTLLTQILLSELDMNRYRPALILAYPRISRSAILRDLASEMEIGHVPAKASINDLINLVQERIFELHSEGLKPVFIIDEVHFLSGDTLHLLRTLSNIETARKKLLTILLFGEETFLKKLKQPKFRAILSRTFVRTSLKPLNVMEVEQYIKFRCLMSGASESLFDENCFPMIHKSAQGIPRDINRLCHNALCAAAETNRKKVDAALMSEIIDESF